MIAQIVATSENNVIGNGGKIPWHISEDFKFFKKTTMGHAMLMGRKTFESLGGPLPGRMHLVVTRNKNYQPDGAVVFSTIEEALGHFQKVKGDHGDKLFIIGGGEIYRQTTDLCDEIYLTRVHKKAEGDVYFPEISDLFELVEKVKGNHQDPGITFCKYKKIRD